MNKNTKHCIAIVLLALAFCFAGCSDYRNPEKITSRKVVAKVHAIGGHTIPIKTIEYIDSMYSIGDTIAIEGYRSRYIVDEIEGLKGPTLWNISKDYQLELFPDSIKVWDMNRLIGVIPAGNTALDKLLLRDNE